MILCNKMTQLLTLLVILSTISTCLSSPVNSGESWDDYITYRVDSPVDESNNEIAYEDSNVCQTSECQLFRAAFNNAINKTVDPCDDFYKFACGNWKANKVVMKYEVEMDMFKAFQTVVEEDVRDLLEREADPNDPLALRKTKRWYRSCMNQKDRNRRGVKAIEFLFHISGDWPLLIKPEEWNKNEWTVQSIIDYYLGLTGEHPFVRILPMHLSYNDTSGHILVLPPALPLNDIIPTTSRNYNGRDLELYRSLLGSVARLFINRRGKDISEHQLNKDINDLIDFERKLYDAQHFGYDHYENVDAASYNSAENDASIQSIFSDTNVIDQSNDDSNVQIDLSEAILKLFNLAGVIYDDSTKVIFHNRHYHSAIAEILKSVNKRTIVNYIHWRFVSQLLPYTNDQVNDIYSQYMKDGFDQMERPSRWRECIRGMKMNHFIGYSLVEKYWKRNVTKSIVTMTETIKRTLKHKIEQSNWLSRPAKRALKQKVSAINTLPGIPDWHDDQKALNNYYKGLTIDNNFVENQVRFLRHQKIYAIRKFAGGEDPTGWLIEPMADTALYIYRLNALTIPGHNLVYPLFGTNTPNYVHYGMIGNIIAHEMGHAFDNSGILLTENYEMPLLKDNMQSMYHDQSQCFTDQLRNSSAKNNHNGLVRGHQLFSDIWDLYIRTKRDIRKLIKPRFISVSQRIADTIGLETAFEAFKNAKNDMTGNLKLASFENYSKEQMFFISYAGTMCEAATGKYFQYKKQSVKSRNLGRTRLNGAVANNKDFAQAFSCPKGSSMNPVVKCNMWMRASDATRDNELDIFNYLD